MVTNKNYRSIEEDEHFDNKDRLSSQDSELEEDDEDFIINNIHQLTTTGRNHQKIQNNKDDDDQYHSLLPISVSSSSSSSSQARFTTKKKNNLKSFFSTFNIRSLSTIFISLTIALGLLAWFRTLERHNNRLEPILKDHQYHPSIQSEPLPNGLSRISLDDSLSARFYVHRHQINWLNEAGDGVYSEIDHRGIVLNDLKNNSSKILVNLYQLVDPNGRHIYPESFTVSSDLRYVLISSDSNSQWRYSKFSNYWIYDTLLNTVVSLRPDISPRSPRVSVTKWSPTGHSIAYVLDNDIYLITSPDQAHSPLRLTTSGTSTIFNGICDWVYEEEVLSASEALWWSPDSKKLVWLSLDESQVPIYELTQYNPTERIGKTTPYPTQSQMKYPKPGFSNPTVSVHLFDLQAHQQLGRSTRPLVSELKLDSEFDDNDRIVMEVAWVSDQELIVRETNRIATREKTGYFDLSSLSDPALQTYGKVVVDTDFVKLDGGWAEPGQFIKPIKSGKNFAPGYLDIRINEEGYRHIAYFSPPDSNQPIFLSSGKWEVDGNILSVDFKRSLVYFIAANPSMERHLYSVKLPSKVELNHLKARSIRSSPKLFKVTPMTSGIGYYSASFSGLSGFYLLSYNGPGVPWQKLVQVDNPDYQNFIEQNQILNQTLSHYALPTNYFGTIKNSVQQDMNIQEIRPYNMDFSGKTKYPVLFKVYGGPNSQTASTKFGIDWSQFLASSLDYLVVYVDGRGTGFKGREFRVGVRNQLGKLEAMDVSSAAQYYASLKYVDSNRIGVWGWSYGGYLTCKTVESYSKDFSMALAVAPVIDWKFYDSIYTERYMSTPALNPDGYLKSAVNNVAGFGNLSFSLAHGSADDNVHFLNSAQLLDRLTGNGIRGFQFRMFTDSDHSISTRGAYKELMAWMTSFLIDRWGHGSLLKNQTLTNSSLLAPDPIED